MTDEIVGWYSGIVRVVIADGELVAGPRIMWDSDYHEQNEAWQPREQEGEA